MGGAVNWRGVSLDTRTAQMMDEVVRLAPHCPIWPTQGSFSGGVGASAGTHDGCGAIDIDAEDMSQNQRVDTETAMRQVGFAAFIRDPSQSNWPWHLHGIAVQPGGKHDRGCLSGAAHDQVFDYFAGRNALASNGPDIGTRAFVGVTWETYKSDRPLEEEDVAFVIVNRQGAARLINGPYISGLYDGGDIEGFMNSGIPVVHGLSDRAFDEAAAR